MVGYSRLRKKRMQSDTFQNKDCGVIVCNNAEET